MELQTVIIIGRSGSGKGTQADMLIDALKRYDTEHDVLYLETGAQFRKFLESDTYSSRLSRTLADEGALQPAFLAVLMWGSMFLEKIKGNEHMILDGTPRKMREAPILESALAFYERLPADVVHIDVSRAWARERMLARGREDDTEENIVNRLDWFDEQVVPIITSFQDNPTYRFHRIDGEQAIEAVHKNVLTSLGISY